MGGEGEGPARASSMERGTRIGVCVKQGGMGFCLELGAVCLKVRASVFLRLLRHEDIYSPQCVKHSVNKLSAVGMKEM